MESIFSRILVPHDLSKHADRALRIAVGLAPARGRLVVLHVANVYGNALVQKRVLAEARKDLARAIARARPERKGIVVEMRVVAGAPWVHIARAARRVDSIVMCTAGRGALSRLVLGSVAEKVVRGAPVPVLTFRPAGAKGRDRVASR
jgi:nucleotide-binding universal stress UspA family protein